MIISCGKFSSSFTFGCPSFSGGDSICISSVFTTTVIVKRRQIFNAHVDDQNQWQQAKIKTLPEQWMFAWNKAESFRDNFKFCGENLPLLMIISGGKFSCSLIVDSSCSGGDSIGISNKTSSIKRRQIFITYVDDQNQRQQAKTKIS